MAGNVPGLVAVELLHESCEHLLTVHDLGLLGLSGRVTEVRLVDDDAGVALRLKTVNEFHPAVGGQREAVNHEDLALLSALRLELSVVQVVVSDVEELTVRIRFLRDGTVADRECGDAERRDHDDGHQERNQSFAHFFHSNLLLLLFLFQNASLVFLRAGGVSPGTIFDSCLF